MLHKVLLTQVLPCHRAAADSLFPSPRTWPSSVSVDLGQDPPGLFHRKRPMVCKQEYSSGCVRLRGISAPWGTLNARLEHIQADRPGGKARTVARHLELECVLAIGGAPHLCSLGTALVPTRGWETWDTGKTQATLERRTAGQVRGPLQGP